jgi:hypothetical protein
MTDSPGTIDRTERATSSGRVNRIGRKARPNTTKRSTLPEALQRALADPAIVRELEQYGARVSFVADAHCTVDGITALRRREFPVGGPSRGVTMPGAAIAAIAALGAAGDWDAAAQRLVEAFRPVCGDDLEVVRIYTIRLILSEPAP